MPRRAIDPYLGFNYKLELGGITKGAFSECSGFNGEADAVEYREGSDKRLNTRKQPGLYKYGNVTLKRGITTDKALFTWFESGINGDIDRKQQVSIVLNDEKGREKVRWNLLNAWPSKWTGPDLKASGNEVAIETLEFCCEGLEWQ